MKTKLLMTAITSLLMVGCSDSNEKADQEQYNQAVIPVLEKAIGGRSSFDKIGITSLDTAHTVQVLSNDGKVTDKRYINIFPTADAISMACKVDLRMGDIEDTEWFLFRVNGYHTYVLRNNEKIAKLEACAKDYMAKTPISEEDFLYVLGDDRIKDNLHYDFLKESLTQALKDDKLTYNEMYNVYKNLDKALELNVAHKIESMRANIKGEKEN